MTAGFKTPLDVRLGDDGFWTLLDRLVWEGSDGDTLIVEPGERTDFASVPRVAQTIMPSTGKWTRAAVVHDMLCRLLNEYFVALLRWAREEMHYERSEMPPEQPLFSSTDTDAVFYKIMRDTGVGWVQANIGWVGVRYGALWNPARRGGWQDTAWPLLGLSLLFLGAALAFLTGLVALVLVVL